jgi:hypothetical protein
MGTRLAAHLLHPWVVPQRRTPSQPTLPYQKKHQRLWFDVRRKTLPNCRIDLTKRAGRVQIP